LITPASSILLVLGEQLFKELQEGASPQEETDFNVLLVVVYLALFSKVTILGV
jgi:hypothetical protein